MTDGARYRLAPIDRTGLVFGLELVQVVCVAGALIAASLLMVAGHALVGVGVGCCGGGLGAARRDGEPAVTQLPVVVRFLRFRIAPPRSAAGLLEAGRTTKVAAPWRDLELVVAHEQSTGGRRRPVAVSRDRPDRTLAVTLRVAGSSLVLGSPDDAPSALAGWGAVLQSLVRERPAIAQLRWSSWTAAVDLTEHATWIAAQRASDALTSVTEGYDAHVASCAPTLRRNDVLIVVSVPDAGPTSIESLLAEVRSLRAGLGAAGLRVSAPLDPDAWHRAVALRLDPRRIVPRTAADAREPSTWERSRVAPVSSMSEWTSWRADDAFHRGFLVEEWPRSDVAPTWMGDLLGGLPGIRTVTVGFVPVPRSSSRRTITRDAAKIESDAAHRAERGFRVGAWHRRATQAVNEREAELVAGHAEVRYAGVVTITAATIDELEVRSEQARQHAAALGVELRPVHGRHESAVLVGLPTARGFAGPVTW